MGKVTVLRESGLTDVFEAGVNVMLAHTCLAKATSRGETSKVLSVLKKHLNQFKKRNLLKTGSKKVV